MMNVVVVGHGIESVALAYHLVGGGVRVTLLDTGSSSPAGGNVLRLPDGSLVDARPHVVDESAGGLRELLAACGLEDELVTGDVAPGLYFGGRFFDLGRSRDILRFPALRFFEKMRAGLLGTFGHELFRMGSHELDAMPADAWLCRLFGRDSLKRFWTPLLEARYGTPPERLPALLLHQILVEEARHRARRVAVLRCGVHGLIRGLKGALSEAGVLIREGFSVSRVVARDQDVVVRGQGGILHARRVVLATTPGAARRLLVGRAGALASCPVHTRRRAVLCGAFVVSGEPCPGLPVTVAGGRMPFEEVVDPGAVLRGRARGGPRVVYVKHRTRPASRFFRLRDNQVLDRFEEALRKLWPGDGSALEIEGRALSRCLEDEPAFIRGFLAKRPPIEVIPSRVYLADASNIYPSSITIESRIGLARRVADWVLARESLQRAGRHATRGRSQGKTIAARI